VFDADRLSGRGKPMREGRSGTVRIGPGCGRGAMSKTLLLNTMATSHPTVDVEVARGHTEGPTRGLRDRELDAPVVVARSLSRQATHGWPIRSSCEAPSWRGRAIR
jgi:hypothetical protein